ncbi:hypothetical protein [Desulfovibrio sp. JC010]|uniref:hypothetical protein n=1 Tax=Desulfovibrio sp. JC010 TaxID=2593641 RepID=UPI0013D87030|nr:hypothetical protein [Desulfovibrio sp. JC010]NDV27209.1 hypothetical protein [Desulfovibrio sp. JC010]
MSGQDFNSNEKSSGLLENFKLGLDVWLAEMKGIVSRLLGNFEVCQLEKRLEKEYALLGKLTTGDVDGNAELCKKQIEFFKDEISRLRKEQAAKRDVKYRDNERKMDI